MVYLKFLMNQNFWQFKNELPSFIATDSLSCSNYVQKEGEKEKGGGNRMISLNFEKQFVTFRLQSSAKGVPLHKFIILIYRKNRLCFDGFTKELISDRFFVFVIFQFISKFKIYLPRGNNNNIWDHVMSTVLPNVDINIDSLCTYE